MEDLKFVRDQETGLIIPEKWKDINGYGGDYQISSYGKVKSYKKEEAVLKTLRKNNTGYLKVSLSKRNIQKEYLVHRLVLIHFDRTPNSDEEANHKDGNKENNFIDNLEWTTHSDNMNHAISKGLSSNVGETHFKTNLTKEDVKEIRDLYDNTSLTQYELGNRYGVHQTTIADIVNYRSWKNI